MDLKTTYWVGSLGLCLVILALFGLAAWQLIQGLSPEALHGVYNAFLEQRGGLFLGALFLVIFLLLALNGVFHRFILPLSRLTEETTLIATVNPAHRVSIRGSRELGRLADSINDAAERLQSMQQAVGEQLQVRDAELEEEKRILAAVVGGIQEGVVVCNLQGDILLYNPMASSMFSCGDQGEASSIVCGFLGLGRSVVNLFDPQLVEYAVASLRQGLEQGREARASFLARGGDGRLLSVVAVPVHNGNHRLTGYALVFRDLTRQMQMERATQDLLEWFMDETASNVAGLCRSIDSLMQAPRLSYQEMAQYKSIICESSQAMSSELSESMTQLPSVFRTGWPMGPAEVREVLRLLVQEAAVHPGLTIRMSRKMAQAQVEVECYSLVQALLVLLRRLEADHEVSEVTCLSRQQGREVKIEFLWRGEPVPEPTILAWTRLPVLEFKGQSLLRVGDILDRHTARVESSPDYGGNSVLSLFLPECPARDGQVSQAAWPAYDFRILDPGFCESELEARPLDEVPFTVFDLETTGLDPWGGDEIVSISAVRLIHGRILDGEVFDRLVNPLRHVPADSVRIHGITSDLVRDQPPAAAILPLFYKFAENTVLVAHSAEFDLAFLRRHEDRAGLRFANPVLDTFQLSVLVHPSHKDHSLEAVAGRMGLPVLGRHTSLGDARLTASILAALIPLLRKRGLVELRQAVQACSLRTKQNR